MLPEFAPIMNGAYGYGVWESFVDSTGTLWVGGDIRKSLGANGVQPTIGFARYAPRDVTPGSPERSEGHDERFQGSADVVGYFRAQGEVPGSAR